MIKFASSKLNASVSKISKGKTCVCYYCFLSHNDDWQTITLSAYFLIIINCVFNTIDVLIVDDYVQNTVYGMHMAMSWVSL